jgi:hypothetical protein
MHEQYTIFCPKKKAVSLKMETSQIVWQARLVQVVCHDRCFAYQFLRLEPEALKLQTSAMYEAYAIAIDTIRFLIM